MDQIELRGLVVQGHIGAFEEERDRLQPLEIDLDVVLDLSVPGESDAPPAAPPRPHPHVRFKRVK